MTRVASPRREIEGLRLASAAEWARIAEFNRTERPFPDAVTLHELFELQVAKHGSRVAVIWDHDQVVGVPSLTYAELNDRVNQLAHLLQTEGVWPGDIVALCVDRSYAMIIGILAILKTGAAYLPLAPDNPAARNEYMLQDAGVSTLLVQTRTAPSVAFRGKTINLDEPSVVPGSTSNPAVASRPTDLAYVIYTSGSTGRPKGVMVEHRSLVNRLHWMQQTYPLGERDVILQKTPYFFDVSVWELFWALLNGAGLCFLMWGGEKNPLAIMQTVKRHRVSVMHFVPSMLNVFLQYLDGKSASVVEGDLGSVRRVFASGEALTPSHVRMFNHLWGGRTGARLTNLYGPTEATVDVSHFDCPADDDFASIPIGRPIHNTKFYVLREGRQVAIGETGELCIAGVGLARGYLNNPGLTDEKFIDNPANPGERIYRTGDLARWTPDGQIEFLGRADGQVKIRGLRIELGEIESATRAYPGVADCVATVRAYSESVVLIVAYLVCARQIHVDALKRYLREQLPSYMVPNHFEIIAEIPLTPSGKADRKALPEPVIHARPK